jgi:uncharacterized protein
MLISFSGGVDSGLLAVLAREVLGDRMRCVLLTSPVVPASAVKQALRIADEYGLALDVLPVPVMDCISFLKNPVDRCYHCKKVAAAVLREYARDKGLSCVADGANVSDTGEHRPGLRAASEEGILHPFIDAGITKEEIRTIVRERGLGFWNKPSAACLASRIPYGDEITEEKLRMIERAEEILAGHGYSQIRVRLHGNIARIEVPEADLPRVVQERAVLTGALKPLGFSYVTLDLEGYRSGSMDEVL